MACHQGRLGWDSCIQQGCLYPKSGLKLICFEANNNNKKE